VSKLLRCAIYTRVSSDQRLEQDFNSLDAQREAAEAYIKSQAHEGWRDLILFLAALRQPHESLLLQSEETAAVPSHANLDHLIKPVLRGITRQARQGCAGKQRACSP
jgi:hypothetical protein